MNNIIDDTNNNSPPEGIKKIFHIYKLIIQKVGKSTENVLEQKGKFENNSIQQEKIPICLDFTTDDPYGNIIILGKKYKKSEIFEEIINNCNAYGFKSKEDAIQRINKINLNIPYYRYHIKFLRKYLNDNLTMQNELIQEPKLQTDIDKQEKIIFESIKGIIEKIVDKEYPIKKISDLMSLSNAENEVERIKEAKQIATKIIEEYIITHKKNGISTIKYLPEINTSTTIEQLQYICDNSRKLDSVVDMKYKDFLDKYIYSKELTGFSVKNQYNIVLDLVQKIINTYLQTGDIHKIYDMINIIVALYPKSSTNDTIIKEHKKFLGELYEKIGKYGIDVSKIKGKKLLENFKNLEEEIYFFLEQKCNISILNEQIFNEEDFFSKNIEKIKRNVSAIE